MLVGCISNIPRSTINQEKDSGPSLSKETVDRLLNLRLDVRAEPKSKMGNRPNYIVAGNSYSLLESNVGYSENGLASWYGNKFHGNVTANGEVFDMYGLSAAHKQLILPALVKITNLENGKSTILRVNDRGPFYADRLIDVSVAAAVQLGFYEKGLAKVNVEVVDVEAEPVIYTIEVGDFADNESALALLLELRAMIGFESERIRIRPFSDSSYGIEIGPIEKKINLEKIESLIKVMGLPGFRVLLKD
tara:strand:+ start:409 stop:1152 length:744 start_codon:yes stop_codon:yes gene_type:complete